MENILFKTFRSIKSKNKYLIFIGLAIALVLVALFLLKEDKFSSFNSTSSTQQVVTLSEEGYTPSEITISEGQSITFQTVTDKEFWPASDSHPSHNIYSEFDPLQPIDSDKRWTFVFGKAGTWYYHDHLYPSYKGKIIVLGAGGERVSSDFEECTKDKSLNDIECWNYLIQKGWEDNGSTGALAALAYLYENVGDTLPGGSDGCHRDTHRVGELAVDEYYKDLENYPNWVFPPGAFYCGYGYFHGVLEHLFRELDNTDLAIEICESISANLSDAFPSIRRNCFHGIGHGFMPEVPGLEAWGNPFSIIKEPLAKCDLISSEKSEVDECYEGIFNVMADWMSFENFGLKINQDDPLFLCAAQERYDHRRACYNEFGSRIPNYINDTSVTVVAQYIEHIEDDTTALAMISGSVAGLASAKPSLDESVSTAVSCRKIALRLQKECFKAIVGGLMAHGIPGKEYIRGIDFCEADGLSVDERNICYNHIFLKFGDMYTGEKLRDACEYVEAEDFNKQCLEI